MKKKILFLVLAFVAGFSYLVNMTSVTADGTPDLANSVTFYKGNLTDGVTLDSKVSVTYYKYVYDAAKGHAGIAYCMNVGYNNPDEGSTVTKTADITDPRLLYILQHGYSAVNGSISMGDLGGYSAHQAYYITQLAVWMYKGKGNGGYSVDQFTQSNPLVQRAIQLYNESAGATETSTNPWIENAVGSFELHYDANKKAYVSDQMHIVGYVFDRYTITLSNAPAGTKLVKANGQEFASGSSFDFKGNDDSIANGNYYIMVPESSVTGNVSNITLNVSANTYTTRVFLYQSAVANKQPLGILVPVNSTISTTQYYKLTKKPDESCESTVAALVKKYPSNRTKSNSNYMNELNNAKKKYSQINTDAGVENPACAAPKCQTVLDYLKKEYGNNMKESNTTYKNELDSLKDKYGINVDAGYENPTCGKPSCQQVVDNLKKKYPKCDPKDSKYTSLVKSLQGKYGLYIDDICEPTCEPKKGPSCIEKRDWLLSKYPNPGDRNKNNSLYVKDVDDIIALGQQNGWQFYTDDYANPDCTKHAKREVRIRKLGCDSDGKTNCFDLPGATLVIKNSKGEIIREWVTDGTTKVFTDLEPGTYTVEETKAPDGYNAGTVKSFTIPAGDGDYSIELEPIINTRPPETADINFTLIMTAFILFLGFGIFGLIKTSQREDM